MSSNRSASNKTANNSKPRSKPTPVTRKRLQAMALSGNPLHSISSNGNRIQSRNIHLLTNVREIKDHCKTLQSQLERMQRESEVQCEELYDKLKKTDGKEIDHLKGLLKKCNDEKEEQDKIIKKYEGYITKDKEAFRKLNEELERKKEEERIDYPLLMFRFEKLNVKYKDNQKLLDEYYASNKLLKSKIKELEKSGSMNTPVTSEENRKLKKELEEKDEIITKLEKELEMCNKEKEDGKKITGRNPLHENSEVNAFIEYLDELKENVLKLYDFYHKKNRTSSYFKSNNMPKQNYITAIISKIEQKIEELERREIH
jgi:hypothetical protein